MAIGKVLRASVPGVLLSWGAKLRFPYLFLLTATVFVADLFIPDVIPFADEIVIGLVTLLLASLKKKPVAAHSAADPDDINAR
ncbi:MAG: hypothetical protein NXI15_09215 [Gammaproteobacteria bacterium]|jgi:hypothetical protein|nr:hypothetical protein [Gammaproteobacteria bacterium]